MSDRLFRTIAQQLDDGIAPGGAATLLAPHTPAANFAHGRFGGQDSPPVTSDTMYDLASVTKLFTTALVLRLHEQKRLSIDDRCGLYLSNFQHSNIRIIDLLTHRLGIDISIASLSQQFDDSESFRSALLALEPPREPLNQIAYANTQFFYLGIIVERVTGHSLRDELHSLFQELKLAHTFTGPDVVEQAIVTPPTELVAGTAIQSITHDESSRMLGGITGHAGVFSTASDLAAFGQAWLDGTIVTQQLLAERVYKDYDPSGAAPQALGWWLRLITPDGVVRRTEGVYVHNGFTGCLLAMSPRTGKVAAFTCNRTYYGRNNTKHRAAWQALVTWVQS